jgi:SWI/SNF-related matrix-associated actin-dependent regulator of chromatin subfamily A-like protein 1
MIVLNETSKEFEISFQFRPAIIADLKELKAKWLPWKSIWTLPLNMRDRVNELTSKHGLYQPDNKPEIYTEIPPMLELTQELYLQRNLFEFQKNGVAQCLNFKKVIIGDEPGLGKTSQAIATVVAANSFPCLVICPSTLKENWRREFEIVAGLPALILTDKHVESWHNYYEVGHYKIFITNYESLKKFFVNAVKNIIDEKTGKKQALRLNQINFKKEIQLFKSVLCDELHRCKDSKTQQAKYVMGITTGKEYVIGLTGTPVVNKPKDLISQLRIIGQLDNFGGYQGFLNRYCGPTGGGAENLNELQYKLATNCFYRREKKHVLKDLPDKIRQVVLCDITTRTEYEAALADLAKYLKEYREKSDKEIEKSLRGEIMVRIGVCKNISARGKMNEVCEYVDQIVEAGEKIVVFIHQKEIAMKLLERYPKAVTVRGDDNQDTRNISVDRFQNDPKAQIIICSIKAAGVGITLTAASRLLFVEFPWHAADCDQCEDRIHRIGQTKGSIMSYFMGKNTIDEHIYSIIESKRAVANQVVGGEDSVQRELIDRLIDSLFNINKKEGENG